MSSGFDSIAPYYDRLARLVFGNSIVACQSHLVPAVKNGGNVLIVGGGTGAFLPALLRDKQDLHVDFVELSGPMINRAKLRLGNGASVSFIQASIFGFVPSRKYDTVFFPFFFDLFASAEVEKLIAQITTFCTSEAQLLVAEFAVPPNSRGWKPLVMKLMYLFFKFTCGITARQLPDWKTAVRSAKWNLKEETLFFHGMMGSFHFVR